ncbi:MarR family winged helix-turn-helix transcriptional regulator [Nonomuraea sp. NPDC047897]|uniref:MarR family winged helix-turn-helix transcriptional regulator n=1 Tax=Nonomuraea sp. NPDC047897 TaxID=3364346 RepID=UPI00371DC195
MSQRMIGYWLKHLDGLFEQALPAALAAHQVSRREWQALNVLASGDDDPRAALQPFAGVGDALDQLSARGWVSGGPLADDGRRLTDAGRRAHEAIAAHVMRVRRQAAEGVGEDEYATTLDVLRRMAANLEAAYGV